MYLLSPGMDDMGDLVQNSLAAKHLVIEHQTMCDNELTNKNK